MADIIRRLVIEGKTTGMAAVTSEVTSVAASLKTAGAAGVQASTGLDRAGRAGLNVAGQLHKLRMSLDEAYRMQVKFKQETEKVTNAIQQGLIPSSAEQTRILDLVRQKYDAATIAATKNAAATLAAASANRQFTAMNIAGAPGARGSITGGSGFRGGGGGAPPGMPPVDMIAGMGAVGGPALQKQMASQDMIAGMSGQMTRLGQATKLTSFEMTNLGMQFNDIAVMAASGQNPFVLIMQQGMQLAQILAMSSVATMGLKGALVALGTAFKSFVTNPIYLAVAATAALVGGLWLWARSFQSTVPSMNDALDQHAKSVKEIADRYKEVGIELRRVEGASPDVLRSRQQRDAEAVKQRLMQDAITLAQDVPPIGTQILQGRVLGPINQMMTQLNEEVARAAPNFIKLEEAMVAALADPSITEHQRQIIEGMRDIVEAAADAQRQLMALGGLPGMGSFRGAQTVPQSVLDESTQGVLRRRREAREEAKRLAEEEAREAKRRAEEAARLAKQQAEAAQRELDRRAEYIDSLRFEQSILNETAEQQAVLNNLRELGSQATAGERAEVEALTRSIEQHNAAMEEWEKKTQEAIGRMDEFRSSAKGILSGAIEGGLKGAMDALADRLIGLGEDMIIEGLFGAEGKAGGGIFGDLVQSLLGGVPEKPVATMNVVAGVVNIGGASVPGITATMGGVSSAGVVPGGMGALPGGMGAGGPGQVIQAQSGATRDMPISAELESVLMQASAATGLIPVVASGGQPSTGTDRVGSHRHDWGGAADLDLRDPVTGRLLNMNNPADVARMQAFMRESVAAGATGVGAGPGYMGGTTRMHVGFGTPGYWGAGGVGANAPPWVQQAYTQGMAQPAATAAPAVDALSNSIQVLEQTANQVVPGMGSLANSIANLLPGALGGGGISGQAASAIASGFGGFFQHGGTLGAGNWGIAGEHGPEIIHGPASVTPMQRGGASKFNVNIKTQEGVTARVTNAQQNEEGDFDLEIFAEAIERRVRDRYGLRQSVSRWGRA